VQDSGEIVEMMKRLCPMICLMKRGMDFGSASGRNAEAKVRDNRSAASTVTDDMKQVTILR
jgi:hypothetical protein